MEWTEVSELYTQLRAVYAGAHGRMQQSRDAYDQNITLSTKLPKGMRVHLPSTAPRLVDRARDQIRTGKMRVKVTPRTSGERARKQAILHERVVRTILDSLDFTATSDHWKQLAFDLLGSGAGCLRLVFDETAWPEPPEQGEMGEDEYKEALKDWRKTQAFSHPLSLVPVDPMYVYPAPEDVWPHPYLIERYTRFLSDIRRQYPGFANPRKHRLPTDEIDITVYWDADTYAVFGDGETLDSRPNPYGIVPYAFTWSGLGRADGSNDPVHKAVSLLTPALSELQAEAALKTAMDAAWQFAIFPRIITTMDARTLARQWDLSPGGIITVDRMEDRPQWLDAPEINAQMYAFLPHIVENIERATINPSLEGRRPAGVDFGYMQSLLVGWSRLKLDAIINAMSHTASRISTLALWMYKTSLNGPIGLLAGAENESDLIVDPEDLEPSLRIEVTFEPADPEENTQKIRDGLALLQSGALSRQRIMRDYFGVEDPDEEQSIMLSEKIAEQFVLNGGSLALLQQYLGMEQQTEQAEAAAQEKIKSLERQNEFKGRVAPGGMNPPPLRGV